MYTEIPDYRYRLIDYVGDGILIGSYLGSPFYFIRGLHNSPRGGRLAGGVHAVRANVPRFAGMIAGRLAVFSVLESGMSLARGRREDQWNTIVAGTGTYGLDHLRRGGAPAAARGALLAAAFFVGMALAEFSFDDWHSRLVRSGREIRMQGWLPAFVPIRRASPCRAAALGDAAGCSIEESR
ncbi:unnamed protein product [Urochloa humidicola]